MLLRRNTGTFLYDHFLTQQLIFVPGDTTKFVFLNWTSNTAGVLYIHLFSVWLYGIYLLKKKRIWSIFSFFLSFLEEQDEKQLFFFFCRLDLYCCRGSHSQATLTAQWWKSIAISGVHCYSKDLSRKQCRLFYRNCGYSWQLAWILPQIHRTHTNSKFFLKW